MPIPVPGLSMLCFLASAHTAVVCCSRVMMRNVLCQSVFQLAITLWMVYNGAEVFGIDRDYVCTNGFGCAKDNSQDELNYADKSVNEYLNTFIFNTFVIMQVCTGPF